MLFSRRRSNACASRFITRVCIETLECRQLLTAAVWTGAVDSNWSNPANWQGDSVPAAGEDVAFQSFNVTPKTITLSSNVTVGSIGLGGDFVLQGASITVDGTITSDPGNNTIDNLVLGHNTTIYVYESDSLTLVNPGDGGNHYGITVEGSQLLSSGTVYITGSNATYTGLTEVAAGVLEVDSPLTSNVQVDSGAVLDGNGEVNGIVAESGGTASLVADSEEPQPADLSSADGVSLGVGSTLFETCSSEATSASDFGTLSVSSGPIDLSGSSLLLVDLFPGHLTGGTVITLISNSTGSPVTGTFTGLPEGTVVGANGTTYQISYSGGSSGHDVTLTVVAPAVWTGGAGDDQWSDAGNWQGDSVPIAGQSVDFPATTVGVTDQILLSQNVEIGSLSMEGSYSIRNDTITVEGGVTINSPGDQISSNVLLDANELDIFINAGDSLSLSGSVTDTSGQTGLAGDTSSITADGVLQMTGPNASLGSFSILGDILDLGGATASRMDVGSYSTLQGNGTLGSLNDTGGIVSLGQGDDAYTITSTGLLALQGGATLSERITGSTSAGELVAADGSSVDLNGVTLDVSIADGIPVPSGHTFTLISNQTGSPVTGTFTGLAEGAITTINGVKYQISYAGGSSGHDVTLTVVPLPASTIVFTSSHVPVLQGQHVTLTATVVAADGGSGTPTGTVTFYDNGTAIGTAQTLTNGTATFNDTNLPLGANSITATYSGDSTFAGATTASALIASVRPDTDTIPTISSATSSASTHGFTIGATVVGADNSPAGAAGLTYTWTAIRVPAGAKNPTFNVNGTNAAGSVIARFSKDGGYILQCKVENAAGNSVTTDVEVTVSQKATSLNLEPHKVHIAKDGTEQFTGTVLDQFGRPMRTAQSLAYAVAAGPGSISSSGLFTATSIGGPVTIELESDDLAATIGAVVG